MSKNVALFVLLAIALGSCMPQSKKEETTEWKTYKSENFIFKIPASLKETTELIELAVAQFQNPIKELYCIVIQEGASAFHEAVESAGLQDEYLLNIDGYAKLIGDRLTENVDEMISLDVNEQREEIQRHDVRHSSFA